MTTIYKAVSVMQLNIRSNDSVIYASAGLCVPQLVKAANRNAHQLEHPPSAGWLVGWFELNALSDSISVYIGPYPKEREKEERKG